VYALIMAAALAKAGAVPVHTWMPSAAETRRRPSWRYLPAALDKLLGIYLLAVLALRMFGRIATMQIVMMSLGG
jgi:formate hydrogenlyase subunit 3/multisubunit Na+/H+ antiporter MnhD subunit